MIFLSVVVAVVSLFSLSLSLSVGVTSSCKQHQHQQHNRHRHPSDKAARSLVKVSHCAASFVTCHRLMCLFMCRERWSEREKARSHILHWNGLSPVCFLKWRVSSSDRANLQPQPFQLQM